MHGTVPTPSVSIPTLAISMGDPAGIGAEVIVKALADPMLRERCRAVVFGAGSCMNAAASAAGIKPFWESAISERASKAPFVLIDAESAADSPATFGYAPTSAQGGELSFKWVQAAISGLRNGWADAAVTGPISKAAWALAGGGREKYPGHTELFAESFQSERYAMFFHAPPTYAGPGMNVILATVHVPLMQVTRHLSTRRVIDTVELADETMKTLGIADPHIGVCGLNPHAGEHGLLGIEDHDVILPAIRACVANGLHVTGPHPADTIFQRALSRIGARPRLDVVVAMYHDQGLIALKTIAWDRAVNMTVGLPIIRTSPDHGTAYDIAGKNLADPGSMKAAISLAIQIAVAKRGE